MKPNYFRSKFESIENFHLQSMPPAGRVVLVEKMIPMAHGVLFLSAKGRVHSTMRNLSGYSYPIHSQRRFIPMFRAAVKLGVLPKEDVELHIKEVEGYEVAEEKSRNAREVQHLAERLGVKLTKAQHKKLEGMQL